MTRLAQGWETLCKRIREWYTGRIMVRTIFWAFILVLALSFFGISLRAIITSPAGQENFGYVWHLLVQFWQWLGAWVKVGV